MFRAEQASVEPLLREREFLWFEAHTAFAGEDAAYKQIEIDSGIVQHPADRWGLPVTRAEHGEGDKCPGAVRTWGFDVSTADGRLNQRTTFINPTFHDSESPRSTTPPTNTCGSMIPTGPTWTMPL